jgi:cobalt-zinc-cadmium resistance protein CzcA
VLGGVRQAVEELNHAGGLPAGVRLEPVYDRTELVENTVHTVSRTLGEGLVLVFLVLLFFLGSLEAAVLTALAVPVALLFASAAMYFAGVSASLLSLGAIDFGIIVDGTLVMVELIVRRLREPHSAPVWEVVRDAVLTLQRPVFFSLLILVSAYLPLFTLERVERRLFTPMAETVCAALLGSLLFSLLVVPVLATWLFRKNVRGWENPLIGWQESVYRRTLEALMRRPGAVVGATAVVLVLTVPLAARLGSEFLPHLDEGVVWIRANLPPGASLEKSAETAGRIREELLAFPEVSLATSQTGRQESNTEPFGPNRNEFLVGLRPYAEWTGRKSKAELTGEMAARLREKFPGITFNFTQPVIDMVTEAVTGSSADLAVILSGTDPVLLRARAGQVLELLRRVPGSADTAIEQEDGQAQVRIQVDREQVARYGINVRDVQDVIELAIGGRPVSEVYEADRVFDIVVRYTPEARSTVANIRNTLVPTPSGGNVALSQLADVRVQDGATMIARRENQRTISVRTNIRGRDQGSFVAEAQRLVGRYVKLPPGYHVEWGGQFENLSRARARLAWILPLTLGVIFVLLYWAFNSVLDGALVLVNVPLSVIGGIVALWVRGIPFSVSAAVGFVSVFGVAVMNGLLCLAEVNRQWREQGYTLKEAVLRGAATQFRPRAMLVTLALLGILPATFATGIGSDVQRPMATVVLGGLLSTLVLGFLVFPGLCYLAKGGRRQEAAE